MVGERSRSVGPPRRDETFAALKPAIHVRWMRSDLSSLPSLPYERRTLLIIPSLRAGPSIPPMLPLRLGACGAGTESGGDVPGRQRWHQR